MDVDTASWSSGGITLPEIDARVSGGGVLIKILCHKRKFVLVKVLDAIEKMDMSVVSTSLSPFGDLPIDNILVNAQMDKEMKPATKAHIVKTLRSSLQTPADI